MRDAHTKGLASLGILALSLLFAGCGGSGASLTPTGPDQTFRPLTERLGQADSNDDDSWGVDEPDLRVPCSRTTNSQSFNGTAIVRGSWVWFSSVMSVPGYKGELHLVMRDSKISFTDGGKHYVLRGPDMRLKLDGLQTVQLRVRRNERWRLEAPHGVHPGDYFLNGAAYHATRGLSGGIENVTWSAKFYSKTGQPVHWQWGAAVFTSFTSRLKDLQVKPLHDKRYPPHNADPAGTPEAYKQFVTGGATGTGGNDYTGGLGQAVVVTPCK